MDASKHHRHGLWLACLIGLVACDRSAPSPEAAPAPAASTTVVAGQDASAPPTGAPAAPDASVNHPAAATGGTSHACMIAGEFKLLGRTLRSRDCMQTIGATTEAELKRACEGLAQTSAQMGGKAGEITYMSACPSPSQGRCKQLFGQAFDGYYYERTPEDLAELPASCEQGGGRWVAG